MLISTNKWGFEMSTMVLETGSMAKKKGRPKQSERDDVSVKIDRTVLDKARLVATHRKIALAEFVTELLRAPVDRAYQQMIREMTKEGSE